MKNDFRNKNVELIGKPAGQNFDLQERKWVIGEGFFFEINYLL